MKIAICITTFNREEVFKNTLKQIKRFLPDNAIIIPVEDAHTMCAPYSNGYRFKERAGIAAMKNKCLEIAMSQGAEHIFLFDDDTYPITKDWHIPYVESQYPHLCFTFLSKGMYLDDKHKRHYLGNGCMLYVHRSVIETIGGFDTTFGIGKYEHNQFSNRVYASGFTPCPYVDIIGSDKLLHCLDQNGEIERTIPKKEQSLLLKSGIMHFERTKRSKEFIDYNS